MTVLAKRKIPVQDQHAAGGAITAELVYTAKPTYAYFLPAITTLGDEDFFDVFNGVGSGKVMRAVGLFATFADTASAPTAPHRVDTYRTSAVGTGGTAHNYQSASRDVAGGSIAPLDTANAALPTELTARQQPTGGATVSEWLTRWWGFAEETNAAHTLVQGFNLLDPRQFGQQWVFREGEGLLVRQGSANPSTSSLMFTFVFTLE